MSLSWSEHFDRLAGYNGWANARLYEACGRLHEADYMKARPAFFGSIHGTLNHILVADRLWLGRLERHEIGITALDQQLYGDFPGLRIARVAEDALIAAYVEGLGERDFERILAYATMEGERRRDGIGIVLTNLFNHQTHHRGQVHDLLMQTEVAPPSLDLIEYLREEA